jgi:hypothetical protein
MSDADDVLAHSEDEGEWDDEPVAVERRPSGSQVLSVRVPDDVAALVLAEAERRGVRLSEVVRGALVAYVTPWAGWKVVTVHVSERVRFRDVSWHGTANPVVTSGDLPPLRAAG